LTLIFLPMPKNGCANGLWRLKKYFNGAPDLAELDWNLSFSEPQHSLIITIILKKTKKI